MTYFTNKNSLAWFKMAFQLIMLQMRTPISIFLHGIVRTWRTQTDLCIFCIALLWWSLTKNRVTISPLIELSLSVAVHTHMCTHIYLMWHKCQPSAAITALVSDFVSYFGSHNCWFMSLRLSDENSVHPLTKSSFTHQFNVSDCTRFTLNGLMVMKIDLKLTHVIICTPNRVQWHYHHVG